HHPVGQLSANPSDEELKHHEYRNENGWKATYRNDPHCSVQSADCSDGEGDGVREDAVGHDVGVEAGDGKEKKGSKQQYPEPAEGNCAEGGPAGDGAPAPGSGVRSHCDEAIRW